MKQLIEDFPQVNKNTLSKHMKMGEYLLNGIMIKKCNVIKRKQGGKGVPIRKWN